MEILLETHIVPDLKKLETDYAETFLLKSDKLLAADRIRGMIISVKAMDGDNTIGLGIAEMEQDKDESEIISIVVLPEYQGKRIGTQIIKTLVANLEENGYEKAKIVYQTNWESFRFMKNHLSAHGWSGPEEVARVFTADISQRGDEIMSLDLPDNQPFSVETWENQPDERLKTLKKEIKKDPDIPSKLDPFKDDKLIAPKCSMVAVDNNRIVGWNMSYMLGKELREYSNLFIHKEYRSRGGIWCLFVSSLKVQFSLGIPGIIGIIDAEYSAILDYYIRRISNNQFNAYSHYQFVKKLILENDR